jgi:predicted RNA binding protein YcfA (HicA-like mRNA interferase family)
MSRLPQVTARQMLAALQRAGFVTKRIKGSHHYLVHQRDPSRRTTVAVHSGDLPPRAKSS